MTKSVIRLTFIALLFAFSPFNYALTVGDKQLDSALNQKLDARVALLNVRRDEAKTMSVALASNIIYQRMGVERSPILEKLAFAVQRSQSGQYYIHITSDFVVSKPFLTFLVELNWNNGRLLREFTLFMDPPMFLDENLEALDVVAAPQNALLARFGATTGEDSDDIGLNDALFAIDSFEADLVETGLKAKVLVPQKIVSPKKPVVIATKPELPKVKTSVSAVAKKVAKPVSLVYAKVEKGEILSRIADKIRPANITVEQMMLALQRENPKAFTDGNLSSLQVGVVLRISDVSTLGQMSVVDAKLEVARQQEVWLASKKPKAPVVVAAVVAEQTVIPKLEAVKSPAVVKSQVVETVKTVEKMAKVDIAAESTPQLIKPLVERPVFVMTPLTEEPPVIALVEVDSVAEVVNTPDTISLIEVIGSTASSVNALASNLPKNDVNSVDSVTTAAVIILDMLIADKKLLGLGLGALLLFIVLSSWLVNRIFYRKYSIQKPLEDPLIQQVPQLTDVAASQTTVVQFDKIVRKNAGLELAEAGSKGSEKELESGKQAATVNS